MKLLRELQHFPLTGVELISKGIMLFLQLNPRPLQLFKISGHVRMENCLRSISFDYRLYNYCRDGFIRHHKVLGVSLYPFERRLHRDGILMPQGLTINLVYHAPSSYKPFSIPLNFILVIEHNALDKHVMGTIPSSITKMS